MDWQQQLDQLYGSEGQDVYVGDPDHMVWMAANSPLANNEWREMLRERGVDFESNTLLRTVETHPLHKEYGGRTLRLPKGFSSVSSDLVARSFLPEATFDENAFAALKVYGECDKVNPSYL